MSSLQSAIIKGSILNKILFSLSLSLSPFSPIPLCRVSDFFFPESISLMKHSTSTTTTTTARKQSWLLLQDRLEETPRWGTPNPLDPVFNKVLFRHLGLMGKFGRMNPMNPMNSMDSIESFQTATWKPFDTELVLIAFMAANLDQLPILMLN